MSDEEILNLEEMAPEEVEAMARRMGHVPLEEFKGDPEKWIEAGEFVKRAVNELPIARGTIKSLNRKLERLEERIAKQSETFEKFNEYHKTALQKTEEEAYNRGLEEAKERLKTAVEEGDVAGAEAAWADAEELRKKKEAVEKEPEKKEEKPQLDPEITEKWMAEHKWFSEVPRMGKYAFECGEYLAKTQPKLTQEQQLEKIAEMVKEEFPEYFENPARKRPGTVDSNRKASGPGGRKKTYNDLPAEAQRLCDSFMAEIKGYTREDYLKTYNGPWKE